MRIIVASDNKSTRDAIAMLVRVQPDLELAGEVDDIADLLVADQGHGVRPWLSSTGTHLDNESTR